MPSELTTAPPPAAGPQPPPHAPKRSRRRRRAAAKGLEHPAMAVPALGYIAIAFAVPIAILLLYSLWKTQGTEIVHDWTIDNYKRALSGTYFGTLMRSFLFVGLSAALAVILTFPFAYFVALKVAPKRRILWLLIAIIPFWTSYLIRVYAWQNIFGDTGILNTALMDVGIVNGPVAFFGLDRPAVVITFVYLLFPLAFLSSYIALERIDPRLFEAARDLGARPWRTLMRVTLPLVRTGLLAGFVFSFIAMMGDYVTPTLIGGTRGILYSNLIVNQFGASLQWGFGASLGVVLLVCVLLMLVLLRVASGASPAAGEYTRRYAKERAPFLAAYSSAFLAFLYAPIALLILFAFNDSESVGLPFRGFTTRWFTVALEDPAFIDAFWTSVRVAVISVSISLVLGLLAAIYLARAKGRLRGIALSAISLPMLMPPVVLGLSLIIGINALGFERGLWTIIAGHILLTLPIVTLLLVVRFEGLDATHELAAMDLGAKPWQAFVRIILPQALPGLVAAAMLGFAFSMDEFILTFLVTGSQSTLPLYIYGSLRFQVTPELNAISSLMLFASFALVLLGALAIYGRGLLGKRRDNRSINPSGALLP
jgi:ABC-type spermidine/putrescine transport system permease subunit II